MQYAVIGAVALAARGVVRSTLDFDLFTTDIRVLQDRVLAAGGPIDQQDILRLLAVGRRDQLIAEVDGKISDLPDDAQQLWSRLIASSS
ncbi:MAG: hypothetical protein M3041_04180 [Acidobacteriota bacterium]|nr:hypothetical protein [Acidobacteriota bacterium]